MQILQLATILELPVDEVRDALQILKFQINGKSIGNSEYGITLEQVEPFFISLKDEMQKKRLSLSAIAKTIAEEQERVAQVRDQPDNGIFSADVYFKQRYGFDPLEIQNGTYYEYIYQGLVLAFDGMAHEVVATGFDYVTQSVHHILQHGYESVSGGKKNRLEEHDVLRKARTTGISSFLDSAYDLTPQQKSLSGSPNTTKAISGTN